MNDRNIQTKCCQAYMLTNASVLRHFTNLTNTIIDNAQGSNILTKENACIYDLSQAIALFWQVEFLNLGPNKGLFGDLLVEALIAIDYYYIAKLFIDTSITKSCDENKLKGA